MKLFCKCHDKLDLLELKINNCNEFIEIAIKTHENILIQHKEAIAELQIKISEQIKNGHFICNCKECANKK